MADKIKKFFARKKADAKFKLAGPGRKLTDEPSSSSKSSNTNAYKPVPRKDLSEESRLAAQAALMRLNEKKRETPMFNTSITAIKAQAKKELELEKSDKKASNTQEEDTSVKESSSETCNLAVTGVYFKCFYDNEILPKEEWKGKIRKILYEQLESGEIADYLIACCIIRSCNKGREKIDACIEVLCKYLENIISNPNDEKYKKIRMSNRVFCEKVLGIDGSLELLKGAGFRELSITNPDSQKEEKFLVFDINNVESMDTLALIVDALHTTEPITLELDRNLQVLSPSQAAFRMNLPSDFYAISPEEIKREQQLRNEAMEKSLMLRTKAMREKDEMREFRKYRYTVLRIRFPDGILLQGTFSVYEKLSEVYTFINENLEHEGLPFLLISPGGTKLSQEEDASKTLIDLRLVPAVMLTFAWDPSIAEEIEKSEHRDVYLKPEVLILMPQA